MAPSELDLFLRWIDHDYYAVLAGLGPTTATAPSKGVNPKPD
ncbi:hypothetical protein ABZV91_30685 [Nocardia sp. NPDC004568]